MVEISLFHKQQSLFGKRNFFGGLGSSRALWQVSNQMQIEFQISQKSKCKKMCASSFTKVQDISDISVNSLVLVECFTNIAPKYLVR